MVFCGRGCRHVNWNQIQFKQVNLKKAIFFVIVVVTFFDYTITNKSDKKMKEFRKIQIAGRWRCKLKISNFL